MRGDGERFKAPIREAEQRADAESPEAGGVSALRRFHSPLKIALRSSGVHFGIHRAVVSFLINHQSVRAGEDNRAIIPGFHGPDFE